MAKRKYLIVVLFLFSIILMIASFFGPWYYYSAEGGSGMFSAKISEDFYFDRCKIDTDISMGLSFFLGQGNFDQTYYYSDESFKNFENLNTIWLHTTDVHITLSNVLSHQKMENSMNKAAGAGCFRVETGKPPTKEEICEIIKSRQINSNGIQIAKEIKNIYGTTYQHANISVWPSYQAENFTTSVGAGDTACVTYFGTFIQP